MSWAVKAVMDIFVVVVAIYDLLGAARITVF